MGDRALIHVHDGERISPCVYLHWGGTEVEDLLRKTKVLMGDRTGDVAYTAARLCGLAHDADRDSNLSLGIWGPPDSNYAKAREHMLKTEPYSFDPTRSHYPYSHGDAGVFLVNCKTWEVECFGGYGFGDGADEEHDPLRISKIQL